MPKPAAKSPKASASALLVGLTHVDPAAYPPDERGLPWDGRSGCTGCDDDVDRLRLILEREGYAITTLLDEAATGPGVLAALDRAVKETKAGDTFFFYYSGHGGQLPDAESRDKDEDDGWDETLCLYDGELRDDDLNLRWKKFPKGAALFMFSDSCHSGTNYRAVGRAEVIRPVDFLRDFKSGGMKASLLHIGGCRDNQESQGWEDGGSFTKLAAKLWDKGRYVGTWDTFHDALCAGLPATQQPQGNLYGPDLGLSARRPFVPLAAPAARSAPPPPAAAPDLEALARAASGARSRNTPTVASPTMDELGTPGSAGFIRHVQERLAFHGLYDALAIDGSPGPFTDWALGEFKIAYRTHDEPGIGPRTAAALLSTDANAFFPLDPGGSSLAARAIRTMQRDGHWICRHPDCVNIVYIEGVDPDGRRNDDRPNVFNDVRMLVRIDRGRPAAAGCWEGTTEPGRHFTEVELLNPGGAARIAFGQYYAWSVGPHPANGGHEALRQVRDVLVHRDLNQDYEREGDRTERGIFFINQHWGYDLPRGNLGNSSAGCLVGRTKAGHREFMTLAKKDARHEASGGYHFTTTILDGRRLA